MSDGITDEMVEAKWARLAPLIDVMSQRIQTPGEFEVHPGSSLARDDVDTSPYQLSHAARWCLNAGVDHLHALKSLVIDSGRIHSYATYSLVRGALENFGAGFWIVHPRQRSIRIEHGMRWWIKNFRDEDTAGQGRQNYKPTKAKVDKAVQIGLDAGCDVAELRSRYYSTPVLKYANEHSTALDPLLIWRLCSGFAHGRPWATLGMNERELSPDLKEGVYEVRFTTDRKRLLGVTLPAYYLMEDFVRLIQNRSM
jgi:hypothetical protein